MFPKPSYMLFVSCVIKSIPSGVPSPGLCKYIFGVGMGFRELLFKGFEFMREKISIVSVCLALFGVSGFYTALLLAFARYIFDWEGGPPLLLSGIVFCMVFGALYFRQFKILREVWFQK